MLLHVLVHVVLYTNVLLEPREEEFLLVAVVLMDSHTPGMHEDRKVGNVFGFFDLRSLEVDAVENSDQAVVDKCHFCCG